MSNFEYPRILAHHQPNQFDAACAASYFGAPEKIIRLQTVVKTVGLSRATIYRLIKLGDFPRPIKLGKHASGWCESAIQSWIRQRAGRQWV
jgi:prophage regulatory protein